MRKPTTAKRSKNFCLSFYVPVITHSLHVKKRSFVYHFQANISVFFNDKDIIGILVYRSWVNQVFRNKGHADLMFSDITSSNEIYDWMFTGKDQKVQRLLLKIHFYVHYVACFVNNKILENLQREGTKVRPFETS